MVHPVRRFVALVAMLALSSSLSCRKEQYPADAFKPVAFWAEDATLKISVIAPKSTSRRRSDQALSKQLYAELVGGVTQIARTQDVKFFPVPFDVEQNTENFVNFYKNRPYSNQDYVRRFVADLYDEYGSNVLIYGHFEYRLNNRLSLRLVIARSSGVRNKNVTISNYRDGDVVKRQVYDLVAQVVSEEAL